MHGVLGARLGASQAPHAPTGVDGVVLADGARGAQLGADIAIGTTLRIDDGEVLLQVDGELRGLCHAPHADVLESASESTESMSLEVGEGHHMVRLGDGTGHVDLLQGDTSHLDTDTIDALEAVSDHQRCSAGLSGEPVLLGDLQPSRAEGARVTHAQPGRLGDEGMSSLVGDGKGEAANVEGTDGLGGPTVPEVGLDGNLVAFLNPVEDAAGTDEERELLRKTVSGVEEVAPALGNRDA